MHFARLFRESSRYAARTALLSTVTNLATPSLAADTQNHPTTATPISETGYCLRWRC